MRHTYLPRIIVYKVSSNPRPLLAGTEAGSVRIRERICDGSSQTIPIILLVATFHRSELPLWSKMLNYLSNLSLFLPVWVVPARLWCWSLKRGAFEGRDVWDPAYRTAAAGRRYRASGWPANRAPVSFQAYCWAMPLQQSQIILVWYNKNLRSRYYIKEDFVSKY